MALPTAVNNQITDAVPADKSMLPPPADPADPVPSPTDPDAMALDEPSGDATPR